MASEGNTILVDSQSDRGGQGGGQLAKQHSAEEDRARHHVCSFDPQFTGYYYYYYDHDYLDGFNDVTSSIKRRPTAVSADGLPLATSDDLAPDRVEQLAAVGSAWQG